MTANRRLSKRSNLGPYLIGLVPAHCIGRVSAPGHLFDLTLDPKLQLGFARCRLYRDRAYDRDLATVEDHAFDVIHKKLPLRVEVRRRLKAHVRVRAELPDARVHKVLMLRRSQRCGKLGLGRSAPSS
jgi:hypothetical protein